MSSIQERLQLKRVPLDTWNVREQLCLASAVVRSGDQNWMSVSRALKTVSEPNRPNDWYSQKSCAAQYGALLEHVETPKRKKRCSEGAGVVETPQESIIKRLTQERIGEIQKTIAEMNQQYESLKNEIIEVRNPATNEDRLREIWTGIEAAKRAREREHARRAASMKEREERRARVDRTWRPPQPSTPTSPVVSSTPSSPLLTSLLKSSPVVTTPQHIPHPAGVLDTMSPSVTAPTLSMLLEKGSPQHESKHAAIEHIKSQLVQIEQQLANASPPAAPPPAVDIDDIEIKAEDVYVFRDVDLPLAHKQPAPRVIEPPVIKEIPIEVDASPPHPPQQTKEESIVVEQEDQEVSVDVDVESESMEETLPEEPIRIEMPPASVVPELKFPTTEIKVIQPQIKIKEEEPKTPEVKVEESQPEPEVEQVVVQEEETINVVEEEISEEPPLPSPQPIEQPAEQPAEQPTEQTVEQPVEEPVEQLEQPEQPIEQPEEAEIPAVHPTDPQDIPLPPGPQPEVSEPPLPPVPELETPEPEPEPEVKAEPEVKEEPPEVEEADTVNVDVTSVREPEEVKKDDDSEDSMPLKQMIQESLRADQPLEETHTETDDDTPMEVSREEEKDGKKRRDYSRKKKPDSRTCSGSESAAEASAPESPHASDAERRRRLWKKSVMLVYSRLCAHKYASIFQRPISDEEAPGYSACVRRPMDLGTIRRNIDNGQIRSTAEFQRDVLLMLSNALLYNSSGHSVYTMAKEMQEEAQSQLGILLAAQAHAGLEAPPRRKRRRHEEPRRN